jgi:hypothetical protein
MQTTVVTIATDQIKDWDSFHSVFQATFGFPDYYGRNMDAWNDCMTYIDDPGSGMTAITMAEGELVALRIDDAPGPWASLPRSVSGSYRVYRFRELSAHASWQRSGAYIDARRLFRKRILD